MSGADEDAAAPRGDREDMAWDDEVLAPRPRIGEEPRGMRAVVVALAGGQPCPRVHALRDGLAGRGLRLLGQRDAEGDAAAGRHRYGHHASPVMTHELDRARV